MKLRPHNTMHGAIGLPPGDPNRSRSMAAVAGTGLDPIFRPMHANIDRAWACWQMNHQNPPTEPKSEAWLTAVKFTFFDVQDAAPGFKKVVMSGQDISNTASITVEGNTQLGYTYDNACRGLLPLPAPAELSAQVLGATQLAASFAPLPVPLTATAEYEGILYLNLPSGALAESSRENFLSYLPFFGIGEHHNHASEHQDVSSRGPPSVMTLRMSSAV